MPETWLKQVIRKQSRKALSNITFSEGDACDLDNLDDAEFDLTISIFGAMFAPKQFETAKEMVRVTKPCGTIVMGNWIPGDPTLIAQLLKISSAYTPPPPDGFVSPMTWGIEQNVIDRFREAGIQEKNISFSKEAWRFNAPYSAVEFVAVFRNYFDPTMNAFEAAEKNGKSADLQKELEDLFNSHNTSRSPDKIEISATYLKVTVSC